MKRALRTLALFLPATALSCSVGSEATGDSTQDVATASWDRAVTRPATESLAAAKRASCAFPRGALPAETLGAELPVDSAIPIKTIVVLMQENRSFDSYFGHLNQYGHRNDIEAAPDTSANPEKTNTASSPRHPWQHAPMVCMADTNHEWGASHEQFNGGRMDGFFQTNQGYSEGPSPVYGTTITVNGNPVDPLTGDRALWWYDQRDIPFYYQLANTFAIADHYHSSVLGPTYPNRDYLYAASSYGVTSDDYPAMRSAGPDQNILIFDELQKRGITWAIYVDGWPHIPRIAAFLGPDLFGNYSSRWPGGHIKDTGDFQTDAKNGTLPQVVFIDGNITEDVNGNDEHPPGDIQTGQKFVSDRVHDLMASPQWKDLALFITWDEHGGTFDHVVPPRACAPDGVAPILKSADDQTAVGGFDQYGVRVPFITVSPYAKKGYVSHHLYDHTSITRFIETRFKLPALSWRDANADPLLDLFDFKNPPFMQPPNIAPATVNQDLMTQCQTLFIAPARDGGGGGG